MRWPINWSRDLSCEVSASPSPVLAAEDSVCRIPVPTGGDPGGGALGPAYNLSYRNIEELLVERGVTVDHLTMFR